MNIIFDMDGVIFDTEKMYLACRVPAAEKFGLTGIEKVSYECIGVTEPITERKLRAFIGDDALYEEFNRETERIFKEIYETDGLALKEGVLELLSYLKRIGAKTALASSTHSSTVKMELRDAGLLEYFDVVIGGEMAGASKPAPDIFLLAAEKLGVAIENGKIADGGIAERCCIIEDSFNGVRAAHASGATVIMVPDMLEPTEEILALTDHVFDSLVDVQAWLESDMSEDQ